MAAFILPIIIFGDSKLGGVEGQSFFLAMISLLTFYASYEINSFLFSNDYKKTIISSVVTALIINSILLSFFGLMINSRVQGGSLQLE
jgi:hypothetical protein